MARVLCHLQLKEGTRILHRDIKPSNILLDDNLDIKLADFGMAMELHPSENEPVGETISCTQAYVPVDSHLYHGHLSHKIDVYSFGVVPVELVTGRKAIDPARIGRFHD
ncbi:Probable serine/threonine-protein kinase PBL11 [Linum perenne]